MNPNGQGVLVCHFFSSSSFKIDTLSASLPCTPYIPNLSSILLVFSFIFVLILQMPNSTSTPSLMFARRNLYPGLYSFLMSTKLLLLSPIEFLLNPYIDLSKRSVYPVFSISVPFTLSPLFSSHLCFVLLPLPSTRALSPHHCCLYPLPVPSPLITPPLLVHPPPSSQDPGWHCSGDPAPEERGGGRVGGEGGAEASEEGQRH